MNSVLDHNLHLLGRKVLVSWNVKKHFSSAAAKRDRDWLEEERSWWVLPLTMICVLWNSNQWFSLPRHSGPAPLLPSLLLRCSSTTFNLGSNCRTKLISYSNVRLGAEALRPTPTTHLTLSITVSSSCNSLNTAAISTLAPNPAVARRHLTKYGKFNYVYR